MHVVLGELVPKSIAIQKTEQVILVIALPMVIFHKVTYPLVYLFDNIAAFFLRLLGLTPGKDSEQAHSEEELRMLVSASHNDGVLDDTEGQVINNMFDFADKTAREVMVPRMDMLCLYLDESYENNLKEVLSATFTRFPLCRTDKDNVIGMIHLRDLLENGTKGAGEVQDLEKLVREVLFVPETQHITDIMQVMRSKQIHMAVVIDEYGGTAGIITLEDIIEEIVGDINDEYDEDTADVRKISENTYEINGLTEQGDVEELLNIDLGDQDDETIAGFVFSFLGRKAEVGDTVRQCGYIFEVTEIDGLRISKIRAYPEPVDAA
jgi:CBS domain containing-hemolysin-like protein